MKIVAIIPARYGSTRFQGKPLALICGKPMIQRVYENAACSSLIDSVVVATDNQEIFNTVESFGGSVCMTASNHATGTDRIAAVARDLDATIIVNVQGDEPLLPAQAIEQAVDSLLSGPKAPMGTLKTKMRKDDDVASPHIVKVVTDSRGFALYFSRSPLPYARSSVPSIFFYRHIGLYVYQKEFLLKFTRLARSSLEIAEELEQLRALEHGYPIRVSETDYYPVGVDVPEDVPKVEHLIKNCQDKTGTV